ncbi:methyl-accepting chemotaxis protein [Motilimonas cestriensis]|uniref:Methyl-accepting chemotaxis protein n=1 Tax=Motilimonas cestriensis TaxID=2742685 RepID=A0ABS8W848_9GAMM|nr:methyl-accepting chemotaxis protein [Motilimonas cestriensis]MCE2594398.1 methyl-accepting chemotaxis protein [Motilimonas cestriensis]
MDYIKNLTVKSKISFLVTVASLSILLMAWFGALELKDSMLAERKQQLKYQVEAAKGVFTHYQEQVVRGEMELERAQQLAFKQLSEMTYGDDGYFFVFNNDFVLKASMKGSSKIGSNVGSTKDSYGVYLYREILKSVRMGGGSGYFEYHFPKTPGGNPDAKLSYAAEFAPWEIVLGSGVYLDDIEKLYIERLWSKGGIFVAILLALIATSWLIISSIVKPLGLIVNAMGLVAKGDVTVRINIDSQDEMGILSREINTMLDSFQGLLRSVQSSLSALNLSADELAVIANQTNTGVQKQMLDVDTVVSAVEQMTLAVKEVEASTAQASEATSETNNVVREASLLINETLDSINQVSSQVEHAVTVVNELEAGSSEIGEVLNVISGISEQTNLLALNAAIEAARAGEAGRGFAVVADEVRSLAHSTKDSTIEIQKMIEKLQSLAKGAARAMEQGRNTARESVVAAGKTGDNLNVVVKQVERVNDMNHQIASATTEQAAVAEEVARSMVNISVISSQTGEGSRETLANSSKVKALSDDVTKQISAFKV